MLLLIVCLILLVTGLLFLYFYLPRVKIQRKIQNKGKYTVGLIADTHIPGRASKIPERVFEIFKAAKMFNSSRCDGSFLKRNTCE